MARQGVQNGDGLAGRVKRNDLDAVPDGAEEGVRTVKDHQVPVGKGQRKEQGLGTLEKVVLEERGAGERRKIWEIFWGWEPFDT